MDNLSGHAVLFV